MVDELIPLLAALPLGVILRGLRGNGGELPRDARASAMLPPRDRLQAEGPVAGFVGECSGAARAASLPTRATAVDDLAQPVVATDLGGRILWWNRPCEVVLAPPSANPVGQSPAVLGLPFPTTGEAFDLVRTPGRTWQERATVRGPDGATAHLLVHVSVSRDPLGVATGFLLVATDIGTIALEHGRIVDELERANRMRSDFVATMSHELRTPLHVILGYADLLHGGEFGVLNDEQAETVERLLRRARELHELVANTLDVSRIDSGGADIHVSEILPGDLVAEAVGECQPRGTDEGPAIVLALDEGLPRIEGDAAKIKVVLKNLVGNALKFTERGTITIAARAVDGGLEIEVADTGIGIDPEILPRIFDAFRQADPSPSRRFGGVGLGLYIVRRLCDLLGARVAVESTPGVGSRFTVWLPSRPPSRGTAPPPPGTA